MPYELLIIEADVASLSTEEGQERFSALFQPLVGKQFPLSQEHWQFVDANYFEGTFVGGFDEPMRFDPLLEAFIFSLLGADTSNMQLTTFDKADQGLSLCLTATGVGGEVWITAEYIDRS